VRFAARRNRSRDYGLEHLAKQRLPFGAACRDLICDVLGRGDIRPLPKMRRRRLHPESLSHIHYLAHIGRHSAQQGAAAAVVSTVALPAISSTSGRYKYPFARNSL